MPHLTTTKAQRQRAHALLTRPFDNFDTWHHEVNALIEARLTSVLDAVLQPPTSPVDLHAAMAYAVLAGGKRLRPLAVFSAAHTLSTSPSPLTDMQAELVLRAAIGLELIHAYSLVHDDLPCMDDDALRRGKPTVHIAFGEANALLVGDALQTLAFEQLSQPLTDDEIADDARNAQRIQLQLVHHLARASGAQGMAGGQHIDLAMTGQSQSQTDLATMHRMKTGALLSAALIMGGIIATNNNAHITQTLESFGEILGLAFQVVDDILDVQSSSAVLGKTAGKDAAQGKSTYVSVLGLTSAQDYANVLYQQAINLLAQANWQQSALQHLLNRVVHRQH